MSAVDLLPFHRQGEAIIEQAVEEELETLVADAESLHREVGPHHGAQAVGKSRQYRLLVGWIAEEAGVIRPERPSAESQLDAMARVGPTPVSADLQRKKPYGAPVGVAGDQHAPVVGKMLEDSGKPCPREKEVRLGVETVGGFPVVAKGVELGGSINLFDVHIEVKSTVARLGRSAIRALWSPR